MHAKTIFLAALTTAVSAAGEYQWSVTNFDVGCDTAGCDYTFDIAGAASADPEPAKPAFTAHCAGRSADSDGVLVATEYKPCTGDVPVTASLVAKLNEPAEKLGARTMFPVQVSYQFADATQADTYWNTTGVTEAQYNRGSGEKSSFTITPNVTFGIA